ncbi:Ger(x)C family spore germination protein [Saccharococcus caldoxylosilyticus]|uniref:Ger(x)C family spore germination protein n=1 Tax=Saccharococcus caldoxylosilyticus TaxID=81408 RepID=UPI0008FB4821|nr:Ger(x)C family spore germination protein [Parageobacillus caldoxylosilyticus]
MSRDHEMRADFYILIARGTSAGNVLKTLDPQENIPANAMFLSLETSEKSFAATVVKEINDLITEIVSDGQDPVITGIKVTGRKEQGMSMEENLKKVDTPVRLNLNGTAVFRDDKLVGWLNDSETKGYNYATGRVKNTVGNIACPNHQGNMAIEVMRTDAKIKGKVKNGRPIVDIYIELEANIGEVECDIDLMNLSTFTKLKRMLNKQSEELIDMAVDKAKEFRSDIFGFGNAIHRSDPKGWAQVKHHWRDRFPDTKVNVHVRTKWQRTGTITESFQKENVK